MMNLTTPIDIPRTDAPIAHTDRVLLLGSCFADEIGAKLQQGGFDVAANPFGTLYNPASIAAQLSSALDAEEWGSAMFFFDPASTMWHSWMHHTRFSSPDKAALAKAVDTASALVGEGLRTANVLIVTLGTAIVYALKESGLLVANCHKQPDNIFTRRRLAVSEIVEQWQALLDRIRDVNPRLRVIFTVSPIRHKRDGMHVNQVSKGILLQAVDELVSANIQCAYFPAYEIMLDELRDYRFYADDMVHPSPLAVEYIWQRFQDTYFSPQTRDAVAKAAKAFRHTQHRPIAGDR